VTRLAGDELTGRDENTDGWFGAQAYLAEQLATFAEPIDPAAEDTDGFLQRTPSAVNVIGVVRGSELPDEYVLVGAHYDGLGIDGCRTTDPADTICNGAADNAAGVAVALDAVRAVVAQTPPRRSIILAFWDREEDGLLGSAEFVADPIVPLTQIVGYVNFDIQGANLSPALRSTTVMVGAETGGPPLVAAATRATQSSSLTTAALSLIFGQGRSDHASLVEGGVPAVFFTDANNGCYHTATDDLAHLDTAKLDQQLATATTLIADLSSTADIPVFQAEAPVATFADAQSMLGVVTTGQPDFGMLPPDQRAAADTYVADLVRIVDEGEAAFDDADLGVLLGGAAALVDGLAEVPCDAYLP
jgi:Zn-dependent M28 family amino/carboxypeptidase